MCFYIIIVLHIVLDFIMRRIGNGISRQKFNDMIETQAILSSIWFLSLNFIFR